MRRLLPVVAATLIAATACGAALSPAIEVNSDEVSRSDLLDQADTLGEPLGAGTSTSVSSEFMGQLIVVRINELLLLQTADSLGIEITDDHRTEAAELLESSNADQFADPEDLAGFVEILTPTAAAQLAMEESTDPNQALTEAYAEADIWVDPRFGTWDAATGQVIPPEGPVAG